MTYSTFITPNYLYKWTVIDDNVDPGILDPFIMKAQDINIQTIIGNTLYVKLMYDISNDSLTGQYKILVDDYVQRCQAEWSVYHALPYISLRITNKSVSEKNSDTSTPTDIKNVQYLREDIRNTAEFLGQRMREYICNNQSLFPEYFQIAANQLQITPKKNNYFGGVYLPDYRKLTREERFNNGYKGGNLDGRNSDNNY